MLPWFPPAFRARASRSAAGAAALLLAATSGARAQDPRLEAVPGSAADRYLRALQVAGEVPLHPWSLHGFSPAELQRLLPDDAADHPWADRTAPMDGVRILRPRLDLVYNSALPYGRNDGPTWAGRGMTVSGSLGASFRAGPLTVRVEPSAFWTQNDAFALLGQPRPAGYEFSDPDSPGAIDLPQRFGDEAFGRVDGGESEVRLEVRGFAAGAGTRVQQWGPAIDQPLLLGPNAAGVPHVFVGTAQPWKVGIGRVHGRILWGTVSQSRWSPVAEDSADRFMAGITGVFMPWGLDGLEVGVSRLFHIPTAGRGLGVDDFLRPVEGFFKAGLDETGVGPDRRSDVENQLANFFVRWVMPGSGELYAEYLREDHNWDLLDAFLEPDHTASYLLGGSRAWRRGSALVSVRAELVNSQASHLREVRNQGRVYRHSAVRQGHTHGGQLLGSPAGYGGGGSVIALESFTPRGRWSVDWTRTRVRDNWGLDAADSVNVNAMTDVIHSLGGEAVFFRGRMDLTAGARASWELNRDFDGDVLNLTATLGVRLGL